MTSKDYIKDIQMFINEAYSDNEPLQDNQIKSKKVFNDYCNKIKQDLERLEELENDKLLDLAEKEELERVNKVLHHNLEEKVEIIFELENKIKQDLEHYHNALQDKYDYSKCPCYDELLVRCKNLEKENQGLKKRNEILIARCQAIPPLVIQNEKLVKATEILKKKKIDVDELLSCETLQEFNDGYYKKWQLTQQEYDLLKEVLGE